MPSLNVIWYTREDSARVLLEDRVCLGQVVPADDQRRSGSWLRLPFDDLTITRTVGAEVWKGFQ
jgi:hypothetical protein